MLSRLGLLARHLKPSVTSIPGSSRMVSQAAMSTFTLPNWQPTCEVRLNNDLKKDQLLSFIPFKNWTKTLDHSLQKQKHKDHPFHDAPYKLRSITIQSVDFFGGGSRIGFIKMTTEVSNDQGEKLPGSILLRGGSVAMLVGSLVNQPVMCHY